MRRTLSVVTVTLLASTFCLASPSYVVPTTTLAAQTSNNTSAANAFKTQSNNNRGAGNISKVDVHTLLYPGATTKIYAHFMGWFGGSNHMNVGYSSTDPTQVKNQIDDLVSRGIDGVIIDWYGPNDGTDQATQLVMAQAETHPGFTFAIMIDAGAIARADCSGCSPQQELVSELQYMERTYFSSPAYMTIQGQPMVTNFNVDLSYPSIDWTAATAALSTHPAFIFQNNDGFTHELTDGSYSWVMPRAGNYGMDYLTSFYDTGLSYPKEETIGAAYKGFNDSLASWGSNRIMNQQCGQTWLRDIFQDQQRVQLGETSSLSSVGDVERLRRSYGNRIGDRQLFDGFGQRGCELLAVERHWQREHGGPLHGIHQQRWRKPDAADGYCQRNPLAESVRIPDS